MSEAAKGTRLIAIRAEEGPQDDLPVVRRRLTQKRWPWPAPKEHTLTADAVATWGRAEMLRAAVQTVASILTPHGVELTLFKGLAVAFGSFGDPSRRPMADADLWVSRGGFLSSVNLLAKRGFAVRWDDPTAVMVRVGDCKVDVHSRVLPLFIGRVGRSALEGRRRSAAYLRGVQEFDDPTQLTLLLAHLAKSRFVRPAVLRTLSDLEVFERRGVTSLDLWRTATELVLVRQVAASLSACRAVGAQGAWLDAFDPRQAVADWQRIADSPPWLQPLAYRGVGDEPWRAAMAIGMALLTRPLSIRLRRWRYPPTKNAPPENMPGR